MNSCKLEIKRSTMLHPLVVTNFNGQHRPWLMHQSPQMCAIPVLSRL